ncbi:MAG: DUF5069 domain-containing protein [Chthoniobacterales bacterium]|nr:DUF5069 domain-containing protein [Chthoniobacterales bacterium]
MEYQLPRSPWETVGGMVYFGRMLDKIRLHHAGTLRPDLIPNLGIGFDAACCEFLGIPYAQLRERVLQGGSDEEILQWCYQQGAPQSPHLIRLWNYAMTRRGWRDDLSERLQQRLAEGGWQNRTDIQTFFDYIDLDEGRDPANSPPKRPPIPS